MKKRIFSMLLAIVMVVGLIPGAALTAFAAEGETTVTNYPLWVGGEQFTSEKLSISGGSGTAVYTPDTNTLALNNYSYTGEGYNNAAIYYGGNDELKLVINGTNSVTNTSNESVSGYGVYSAANITVSGEGSLSGTSDGSVSHGVNVSGNITVNDGSLSGTGGHNGVYANGSIAVNGGSLTGTSQGGTGIGVEAFGSITVNGGTLSGTGHYYGVYVDDSITVESGGLIGTGKSGTGVYASKGNITVNGGNLSGLSQGNGSGVETGNGSIMVLGGTLSGTSNGQNGTGVYAEGTITIIGGTVTADGDFRAFNKAPTGSNTLVVYDVSNQVIAVPVWTGIGALNYAKIVPAAASVTTAGGETTNYTDITSAIEAAQASEGSMLTLLDDITATTMTTIDSGSFTLDLNGQTWQRASYLMQVKGNSTNIKIIDSSTEKSGKLLCTGNAYTITLYGNANLEIAGGTVENNAGSEAIAMDQFGNPSQATLIVSGGKVVTNGYTAINAFGNSVTVTGGTLESGEVDIYYHTGKIDLSAKSDSFDPTGITIYNNTGADVTPGEDTIKLPDGYVMLDSNDNAVTTLVAYQTYTVGVAPITHSVGISAIDSVSGNAIAGATMQLINSTGNVVDEWVSEAEAHTVEGLKTDEVYTLRVAVAPDGYVLPSDITFSIDESGNVSSTGTVSVDGILLVEFAKTMVKISAVESGAGEAIEGAHMQILNAADNVVDEWGSTVDDEETAAVDESIHEAAGLKTGTTYTLHTDAAPAGYAIASDTTFSINENGKVISTGVVTEEGIILSVFDITVVQFSAVDGANGTALAGATMQILDKNGNLVEEWVSAVDTESTVDVDESVHTVTGLNSEEEYTLRVVVAPDGYSVPTDITFSIDRNGIISTTGSLTGDGIMLVEFAGRKFTISIAENIENGTVTANKTTAAAGEIVTLTVTPEDGYMIDSVKYNDTAITANNGVYAFTMPAGDVSVTATFVQGTTYPLWVGGEQFTSEKLTITDGSGGMATYDPDTNTLTLNNYTYSGVGYSYSAIYSEQDMTIRLVGENSLVNTDEDGEGIAIWHADLVISGSGTLHVTADYGISAYGNVTIEGDYEDKGLLTIQSGTLNITASKYDALYAFGDIKIENGTFIIAAKGDGIWSEFGDISISGGQLNIVSAEDEGIDTAVGDITISGGTIRIKAPNDEGIGVGAEGVFTMSGGTVDIEAGEDGIDCTYAAKISGGQLDIVAGESGIEAYNDVTITGGSVTIQYGADSAIRISGDGKLNLGSGMVMQESDDGKVEFEYKPAPIIPVIPVIPSTPSAPPATEVTVPISGDDNTIHVDASVSGDKATVDEVDLSHLNEVIGDHVDTGTVTIDFSGLNSSKGITTVEIPASAVKEIAEAVNDPANDAHSFEVILSDGMSIEFDAEAMAEKAAQADGLDITISIEHHENVTLTEAQKNAVGDRPAFDINVTSGGEHISDMGGKISIHLPYELAEGEDPDSIVVWYVDDRGKRERCETSYDPIKKRVNWKTDHLSLYMIDHCPSAAFDDLDTGLWYHEATDYVLSNGLMNGVGNKLFDPNGTTSRAMIVTILWRLEGEPVVNYLMQFEDVAAETWYTEAVRWAASEGIVEGYSNTSFGPNDPITREQLATILYRYEQHKGGGFTGAWMFLLDYTDRDKVSDWAYEAMCWTTMHGVINGKGDGILDPKGNAKRCEAAQMLMNYLDK